MIDDFGDDQLNRKAQKYRNALNDFRPAFANDYLLQLMKPLDSFIKEDLIEFFSIAIANKIKINPEDINDILDQDIPSTANY
jgi:hypothetical protein|tara:strand:+ start:741 stop:986 length:246 start_codon:yes stop_codon:yes gene_type:complete